MTKKDVEKFRKRFQCFSKLLLLYPTIHPATIHGLLVEFNYDYGFVMQFILKLESQRNTLYWDEVGRVSHIMEEQNRARTDFQLDANNANQRLSQMMDNQMCNAINSYAGSSNNDLQLSPLMEVSGHQISQVNSGPTNFAEIMEYLKSQINILPEESGNVNQIMQVPATEIAQLLNLTDPNSFNPHIIELLGNQNIISQSAETLENQISSIQTFSNSNTGSQISENQKLFYINTSHETGWKIYEMIEAAKSQMTQICSHPNDPISYGSENTYNLDSAPRCSNWQSNKIEQTPKVQGVESHSLTINRTNVSSNTENTGMINVPILQRTGSQLNLSYPEWHLIEDKKNLDNQTNKYPIPDDSNFRINQMKNHLQQHGITDVNDPEVLNYLNSSSNNTNWQIIEIMDFQNLSRTKSQYELPSGYMKTIKIQEMQLSTPNSNPNYIRNIKLMGNLICQPNQPHEIFNTTNWQINEIIEHPKILMTLSRRDSNNNPSNNENIENQKTEINPPTTKPTFYKRIRKQKLQIMKSTSEPNNIELQDCKEAQTPKRKAVKRHLQGNNSELPIKRARKEGQMVKLKLDPKNADLQISKVKGNHRRRANKSYSESKKLDEIKIKQENEQIQAGKVFKNNRHNRKHFTTKSSKKRKMEIIKSELKLENMIKKKSKHETKKQRAQDNEITKTQEMEQLVMNTSSGLNKNASHTVKVHNSKKRKVHKPRSKRNKIKSKKKSKPNYPVFEFGTDFLKVDPHTTTIEHTAEGQVITVCPNRLCSEAPSNIDMSVQFIRKYPNNRRATKKQRSKLNKTGTQTSKIMKTQNSPRIKFRPKTSNNEMEIATVTKKQKAKGRLKINKKTATVGMSSKCPSDEKDYVNCCCQSIEFKKKYKLPPYDKDVYDLLPNGRLNPNDDSKPKKGDPYDPSRETLCEYYKRNPDAEYEFKSCCQAEKPKLPSKKTRPKKIYNTRSNKEKNIENDA